MLTPAQVIVFLSHDDADVRARARDYLTSAHDPAPATADDFWAAADKLGGGDDAAPLVDRLGLVPQTSGSIKRVLDELPKADPASAESLLRALERVKLDLLREHWDAIRTTQAVPEHLRAHLQSRIDLANEPAEGAFDRMMSFAEQLRTRDVTGADELEAERLIEAVARRPDLFADRVVAALSDENVKEWAELLVTDVAGEMRLENAVPALLEKLKRDDSELLWEVASDALVHIGNESVIRQIVERFADASIGFRISGGAVLGRIKRPESQAALLQLLDVTGEADDDARTTLVAALVDLLPDDEPTFTRLREIARDGRYNRRDVHLDEELLSLATLTGQSLPEADEWRTRIASDRERWAMGMSNVEQLIDRPGAMSNVDQLIQSPAAMGRSMLHVPPLAPRGVRRGTRGGTAVAERPEGQARRQPYRNAKPKVGRNDPCPCGSGKKFKKCCGK